MIRLENNNNKNIQKTIINDQEYLPIEVATVAQWPLNKGTANVSFP